MRKKILAALIGIACMLLPACTRVQRTWKTYNITGENLQEHCPNPMDYHTIFSSVFGVQIRLLRLENCLEFEHLLVALWFGEDREVNRLATKLAALMYIDSLNLSGEQQFARVFLKRTELVDELNSKVTHMLVFELVPQEENILEDVEE